jgi:hypothetical protein
MPFWYDFDKEKNEWKVLKNRNEKWKKCEKPKMPEIKDVKEWCQKQCALDIYTYVKARAESLGFYGYCEWCNGSGEIWQTKKIKKLHDNWESFEPPLGDGYQLWETTSEGSPISPIFKTLDDLCEWSEKNAYTFAHYTATKEEWKNMFFEDFVCYKEKNFIFM